MSKNNRCQSYRVWNGSEKVDAVASMKYIKKNILMSTYRPCKHVRVLRNDSQRTSQRGKRHAVDIHTVNSDAAAVTCHEAEEPEREG